MRYTADSKMLNDRDHSDLEYPLVGDLKETNGLEVTSLTWHPP